jgi:hypothetical protein
MTITELHSDLADYVFPDETFGQVIHHPLVIWFMPLNSMTVDMVNTQYEQKRKAVEEALDKCEYERYIWLHERPYRLQAFISLVESNAEIADADYWKIIGDIWTDTENAYANLNEWEELFGSNRSERNNMMNKEEIAELNSMPETLTIYRGCLHGLNEDGVSWTTDRDRAEWFANRFGSKGLEPCVLQQEIRKDEVIAYFTRRGESEVLTLAHPWLY